jgi:hypothetical protein
MTDSGPPTTVWHRPAAPDRHGPKGPVPQALCPFGPRRPASTVRHHPAARGPDSIIYGYEAAANGAAAGGA